MSLRIKLIFLFLAIALIPLFFVSVLTFHNYKNSLETTRLSNLRDITVFKADKIETYFSGLKGNIETARGFYNIKKNLPVLTRLAGDPNNPEFMVAKNMLDEQLQQMQSVLQLSDIMLVNPEGKVVYSSNPRHYPKDFSNPLADPEQKAFEEGKNSIYLSDIFLNTKDDNRPTMLITAPAIDFNGVSIGVIVFEVDTTTVYKVVQDVTGLGMTGEVLVGRRTGNQVVFLTPLKFDPQATLTRKVDIGQDIGGPVQEAVQGKTGAGLLIDYRGKKVIAAWRYIPSLKWGMVAKIDADEAFAEAIKLRNLAIIILAIVIVLSGITAFSIAQSIAEPIKKLSQGAAIIGSGNLDYKIGTHLKDEIGQLSRTFDKMTGDLKQTLASRDELNREVAERKQAEEILRENEERLSQAMGVGELGSWGLDTKSGKAWRSLRHDQIFGYPELLPEWTYKMFLDHVLPEDRSQVDEKYGQSLAKGKEWGFECRIRRSDGAVRWIWAQGKPRFNDRNEVVQLFGLVQDITERKKIEETLRESQKRLSSVFQTSPAGIFVTRLADGLFLEANEAYQQIIGYPAEEILGRTSLDLNIWVNQEDRKKIINLLHQQGHVDNSETKFRRKNGEIADIFFSAVLFEQAGEPCILGALMDVTERKKAEEALRESQLDLNRAQAVAHVGSWRMNVQQNELTWSDENHHIFGISEGTPMTYETFLGTIHPDDRDFVDKKWEAALTGEKYDVEHRIVVDGKIKWVRERAELEFDKTGVLLGGFGTTQDITSRKKMEEEIRRSVKRFELLSETAGQLLQSKNPQQIVNMLCHKVMEHLDCHIFVNYLVDESIHRLHLNACAGMPEKMAKDIEWLDFGQAICGRVAQEGKRIVAQDIQESCDSRADLVRSVGIRAYACHPLLSQSGVIGTLSFGTRSRTTFSEEDLAMMKTVADQVATAMERIRAEEALRKSRDELEMRVKERTKELAQTVDVLENEVRERVLAEKTAKNERKRFEDVLEMLPAYAVLLTPDYHVAYANRTFREWFGDDNGKKCYEFLFNRTEPCENCQTYAVLKTQKSQFWEWTGPNGHNYDIYDYPFTDTNGSPLIMEIGVDVTAHKKAQEAVRQGEERYRSLTVATTQVIWTTDAQGQVVGDMPSWRAFTGQSVEEIQGWGWINALHPDDRDRTAKIWTQSVQNKNLYETEYRIRWHYGGYRYVSVRGVPVLEQDGSIREWIGTCTDITERKLAEEALRSASLYSRGLLEASLDPLVTISSEGKITDVNKATELATGAARETLIGSDFSSYFTEPQKANEGYRRVISEGFVKDYPLTIRHVSGGTMDVLYNATVYKNQAGQVQGIFAAARDITERKAVQKKQGVTNSLLKLFARKTLRKTYLDSTVKIIRNWSGCEFVGIRIRDNEENIPYESHVEFDKDFLALENDLNLDRDSCVCIRAILQQSPQQQERDFVSAGGSFYCNDSQAFLNSLTDLQKKNYRGNCIKHGFQSISVVPIRYRDEILGAIHIADFKKDMVLLPKVQFIEATIAPLIGEAVHRFNAESELEKHRLHLEDLVTQRTDDLARSNKDLEQFAYVASHDLQEPLRAVSGFVELLRRNLQNSLDTKTAEYMNFTVEGAKRMQSLINGLLEYSRISARGKKPEQTDSKAALDLAIAHLLTSIKESDAKITAEPLPTIHIDPVQLTQLFQNLIGNAIKFRSEERPPEIHISADHQANAWQFAVTDNGIGIEPQYAERIFLIFQRLHTREKYPGTGIGLALCKKIIERHGGKIWVESKYGQGSTFYFTVPDIGDV